MFQQRGKEFAVASGMAFHGSIATGGKAEKATEDMGASAGGQQVEKHKGSFPPKVSSPIFLGTAAACVCVCVCVRFGNVKVLSFLNKMLIFIVDK